jgi:hypothetical protein
MRGEKMTDMKDSDDFVEYLLQIAQSDGILSSEEQNFINVMQKEIDTYYNEFKTAIEDGVITHSEKISLFQKRLKILQRALDTVLTDFSITDDEHDLLDELKVRISQLEDEEKKYSEL